MAEDATRALHDRYADVQSDIQFTLLVLSMAENASNSTMRGAAVRLLRDRIEALGGSVRALMALHVVATEARAEQTQCVARSAKNFCVDEVTS